MTVRGVTCEQIRDGLASRHMMKLPPNTVGEDAPSQLWRPRNFQIVSRFYEAPSYVTLRIRPDDGLSLPRPSPGQFCMLYVPGVGEIPISLSGICDEAWEHTIRSVGSVSTALCGLSVGDALGIRGPFGRGWPLELSGSDELLVVAGGLGLAPLKPVLDWVAAGQLNCRKATLLCGFRDPSAVLYGRLVPVWNRRFEIWRTVDTVSVRPAEGEAASNQRVSFHWTEPIGFVHTLLKKTRLEPARTVALICGPEVMMRAVSATLLELGVSESRIFVSLERSMKCAFGHCGHCQLGPTFICKDGPIYSARQAMPWMRVREL